MTAHASERSIRDSASVPGQPFLVQRHPFSNVGRERIMAFSTAHTSYILFRLLNFSIKKSRRILLEKLTFNNKRDKQT